MNIVLDTNIWVSYFLSGNHEKLVNIIFENHLTVFTSSTLVGELEDVLKRPKIRKYIKISIKELVSFHLDLCTVRDPKPVYKKSPDPKDNFLFDLAIQTNSKYIVTGDKLMLAQKPSSFNFISRTQFERMFL